MTGFRHYGCRSWEALGGLRRDTSKTTPHIKLPDDDFGCEYLIDTKTVHPGSLPPATFSGDLPASRQIRLGHRSTTSQFSGSHSEVSASTRSEPTRVAVISNLSKNLHAIKPQAPETSNSGNPQTKSNSTRASLHNVSSMSISQAVPQRPLFKEQRRLEINTPNRSKKNADQVESTARVTSQNAQEATRLEHVLPFRWVSDLMWAITMLLLIALIWQWNARPEQTLAHKQVNHQVGKQQVSDDVTPATKSNKRYVLRSENLRRTPNVPMDSQSERTSNNKYGSKQRVLNDSLNYFTYRIDYSPDCWR
jgi:hypothetical protein